MIFSGDIAQPCASNSTFTIPQVLLNSFWVSNLEGGLVAGVGHNGVFNSIDAITELVNIINVKAFIIANNHLLDSAPVPETMSYLNKISIPFIGGGNSIKEASRPVLIKDIDNTVYRILAFGWSNIDCVSATEKKEGVNPYSRTNVMRCVKEALTVSMEGEKVICFFHWNYELEKYPQPYDRHLAHELIDMGVTAVIGCHAHRVQPVEFYKKKPIVYGLGNFLFYQGHYFNGKLRFPRFCEEEYAFEISKEGYKLHYFHYDQLENRLEYVKSVDISEDKEFDGKAEFTGYTDTEYERWFKEHRIQKKMLPVFHARENELSYWMKSKWIKFRGGIINQLTKMNLKSANRANR